MTFKTTAITQSLSIALFCQTCFAASNQIESIQLLENTPEQQIFSIQFKEQPLLPKTFAIANPSRIAMDFNQTSHNLKQKIIPFENGAWVQQAQIIGTAEKSRLILTLKDKAPYQMQVKDKALIVKFKGISKTNTMPINPSSHIPTVESTITQQQISRIDFRRTPNGGGRVIIQLPVGNQAPELKQEGENLIVLLKQTHVPNQYERRLDVTDFATPVRYIDAQNMGGQAKVVIKNTGTWRFTSFQTDKQLNIDIQKPSNTAQNNVAPPEKTYKGEKLSFNFQNVDVRTLLQVIAEFSGFNIVTSDSVAGNLTLRLTDVPWDQALDLILEQKGLEKKQIGNIIRVAPRNEMLESEKQLAEARRQQNANEATQTETFQVRYRGVEEMEKALKDLVLKSEKDTGGESNSILVDPRTNKLIIRAKESTLEEVKSTLKILDVPLKQVLIEARIVEATDDFQRDLGVKLGFAKVGGDTSVGPNYGDTPLPPGSKPGLPTTPNINLPAASIGGSIGVIYRSASSIIGLELSAMQEEKKGKIISSPRVLTADRTKAVIEEGTEVAYKSQDDDGKSTTEFKKAALNLTVTPQITPDNEIIMVLDIKKDSVLKDPIGGEPAISTKSINTQVRVLNGGTIVIGGIFAQEQSEAESKVPLLGDIPVLGNLFKSRSRTNNRRELLVFITPKIVESEPLIR